MASGVWRCKNCQSLDVPLNGGNKPQPFLPCQFGVAVGKAHKWERLTDQEWQRLRDLDKKTKTI